jgi:hypothetical protein
VGAHKVLLSVCEPVQKKLCACTAAEHHAAIVEVEHVRQAKAAAQQECEVQRVGPAKCNMQHTLVAEHQCEGRAPVLALGGARGG